MRRFLTLITTCVILLLSGCSDYTTPEEEIKNLLKSAVTAAEKREISKLHDLVGEHYRDKYGNRKNDIRRIVAGYYIRNTRLFILMHIGSLRVTGEKHAKAILYVAMADRPIVDTHSLKDIRAELYETKLELKHIRGSWKVVSSQWQQLGSRAFFKETTELIEQNQ